VIVLGDYLRFRLRQSKERQKPAHPGGIKNPHKSKLAINKVANWQNKHATCTFHFISLAGLTMAGSGSDQGRSKQADRSNPGDASGGGRAGAGGGHVEAGSIFSPEWQQGSYYDESQPFK
jgi:hypothetical protein